MRERDNRLYELRCSRKLSQGVVGDMLNLSQTRVSAYERGGSIPSEILKQFADFYGVTIDYILCLSDDRSGTAFNELLVSEHHCWSFTEDFHRSANRSLTEWLRAMTQRSTKLSSIIALK